MLSHLSPRECIWDAIIFSLDMSDIKIVLLQYETPSELTLVLVFHFMNESVDCDQKKRQ